MDYRQRIKALRKEHKETQVELANICGTTDGNIGHWENLRGDVPIDALIKICKHYNVSSDYILGLTPYRRIYPRDLGHIKQARHRQVNLFKIMSLARTKPKKD